MTETSVLNARHCSDGYASPGQVPRGSLPGDVFPRRRRPPFPDSHRDRSGSAARSVVLRVEIGPHPARDRSYSASRSVRSGCGCGPAGVRLGEAPSLIRRVTEPLMSLNCGYGGEECIEAECDRFVHHCVHRQRRHQISAGDGQLRPAGRHWFQGVQAPAESAHRHCPPTGRDGRVGLLRRADVGPSSSSDGEDRGRVRSVRDRGRSRGSSVVGEVGGGPSPSWLQSTAPSLRSGKPPGEPHSTPTAAGSLTVKVVPCGVSSGEPSGA